MILIILVAVTALMILWVVAIRPWLREKPFAKPFFDWIEPFERWTYSKSETILWGRFQALLAAVVFLFERIGAFDPTPFLIFVPDEYKVWVTSAPSIALGLSWIMMEFLRRDTSTPLEVVAAAPSPAMEEAKAVLVEANKEAKGVAATEAVKAEK